MARELTEETRALVRSRIPDYENLDPREQARQAIKVIAKDFWIYVERNLMIKDKRGMMVPLEPNWAQRILVERVLEDLVKGVPVRYIILKARQMGLSTIIEALAYWWTTTNKYQNAVIIAHKKKAAQNLYKMFRRYYDNAHPQFKPTRKYNTVNALTFDVEDKVKEEYAANGKPAPGMQSEIQTMVAGEGEGRSDTILFFHGSEVAFWDNGADVLSSALQAVPLLPNTFAFLESTANGVGGYFYDEWQFAKKGESRFKPVFFAWHEHPEYEIEGTIVEYDDEEKELLEIFAKNKYPRESWDRKIMWRREKKKEFRSDPGKFYQEYPKDDTEAFLASGRSAFDTRALIRMEERARIPGNQPVFGSIEREKNDHGAMVYTCKFAKVSIEGQDPTPLKIWELPQKDVKYTIGIDVSEGLEISKDNGGAGDYSVIDVMRTDNLKTVARWRGHVDPDMLGDIAFDIGSYYNMALIGCETNNQGLTTVQRLRDKFYRNLYMRETSEEDQFQQRTNKMGWQTNRKTKPIAVNELRRAIREGDIIDLDVVFIRECMTYAIDDNGHFGAQENMFDDCVMAKAINLQMAHWNAYDLSNVNIHKPTVKQRNETNSGQNKPTLIRRKTHRSKHRAHRTLR